MLKYEMQAVIDKQVDRIRSLNEVVAEQEQQKDALECRIRRDQKEFEEKVAEHRRYYRGIKGKIREQAVSIEMYLEAQYPRSSKPDGNGVVVLEDYSDPVARFLNSLRVTLSNLGHTVSSDL